MDKDVSIIVPVYNVKKYIERCVNSLINQTFTNIEIILVDDGSTDGSELICDKYAEKDSRIRVVHKTNGGLSDARNTGMNLALGRYILFVDSDDYIDKNAIQKLLTVANKYNAEIVEAKAIAKSEEGELDSFASINIEENKIYDGVEYALARIKNHCFYAAAPFKLYNLNFLKKHELKFKYGRLHEDELWNPQVILRAKKIVFIDYPFYYYDISRENSIMSSITIKNIESVFENCYELVDFYKTNLNDKRKRNIFLDYVIKQYVMICLRCTNKLDWYKKNRNIKFVLENAKSLKMKFVVLLWIVNVNMFVRVMSYYRRGKS